MKICQSSIIPLEIICPLPASSSLQLMTWPRWSRFWQSNLIKFNEFNQVAIIFYLIFNLMEWWYYLIFGLSHYWVEFEGTGFNFFFSQKIPLKESFVTCHFWDVFLFVLLKVVLCVPLLCVDSGQEDSGLSASLGNTSGKIPVRFSNSVTSSSLHLINQVHITLCIDQDQVKLE